MAERSTGLAIVVRSGPGTPGAERALALAAERSARGEATALALLGDAVLIAQQAAATDAQVACLADDVSMRGISVDAYPNVTAVDYAGIVDLLMDGKRVVGAL